MLRIVTNVERDVDMRCHDWIGKCTKCHKGKGGGHLQLVQLPHTYVEVIHITLLSSLVVSGVTMY